MVTRIGRTKRGSKIAPRALKFARQPPRRIVCIPKETPRVPEQHKAARRSPRRKIRRPRVRSSPDDPHEESSASQRKPQEFPNNFRYHRVTQMDSCQALPAHGHPCETLKTAVWHSDGHPNAPKFPNNRMFNRVTHPSNSLQTQPARGRSLRGGGGVARSAF